MGQRHCRRHPRVDVDYPSESGAWELHDSRAYPSPYRESSAILTPQPPLSTSSSPSTRRTRPSSTPSARSCRSPVAEAQSRAASTSSLSLVRIGSPGVCARRSASACHNIRTAGWARILETGGELTSHAGAYSASDPGININIYDASTAALTAYQVSAGRCSSGKRVDLPHLKVPGPAVWSG